MILVDSTYRYTGFTLHLTPGPSPVLRHAIRADVLCGRHTSLILQIPRPKGLFWWLGRVLTEYFNLISSCHRPYTTRKSPHMTLEPKMRSGTASEATGARRGPCGGGLGLHCVRPLRTDHPCPAVQDGHASSPSHPKTVPTASSGYRPVLIRDASVYVSLCWQHKLNISSI